MATDDDDGDDDDDDDGIGPGVWGARRWWLWAPPGLGVIFFVHLPSPLGGDQGGPGGKCVVEFRRIAEGTC